MYKELENKIDRFIKSTVETAETVEAVRLLSVGEIYDTIIEKLNNKNQFPKADRDLVMSKISGAVTDQIIKVAAGLKQEDPTPVVTSNVVAGSMDIDSIGEDHSFKPIEAGKEIELELNIERPTIVDTIKEAIKEAKLAAVEETRQHFININKRDVDYDGLFPFQESILRMMGR